MIEHIKIHGCGRPILISSVGADKHQRAVVKVSDALDIASLVAVDPFNIGRKRFGGFVIEINLRGCSNPQQIGITVIRSQIVSVWRGESNTVFGCLSNCDAPGRILTDLISRKLLPAEHPQKFFLRIPQHAVRIREPNFFIFGCVLGADIKEPQRISRAGSHNKDVSRKQFHTVRIIRGAVCGPQSLSLGIGHDGTRGSTVAGDDYIPPHLMAAQLYAGRIVCPHFDSVQQGRFVKHTGGNIVNINRAIGLIGQCDKVRLCFGVPDIPEILFKQQLIALKEADSLIQRFCRCIVASAGDDHLRTLYSNDKVIRSQRYIDRRVTSVCVPDQYLTILRRRGIPGKIKLFPA